MSTSFPQYARLLLLLVSVTASACNGTAESVTGPAPAASENAVQASLGVEPQTLRPEFLHGASCVATRPFGARFNFIVRGGEDLILRGLQFSFTDRRGAKALPEVFPIPSLSTPAAPSSTIPTSSPIPVPGFAALPGASPIPIPGSTPVTGLVVSAGTTRVLPFFARFACGVLADGTLLIVADTGDRSGRFHRSEVRVRIGS